MEAELNWDCYTVGKIIRWMTKKMMKSNKNCCKSYFPVFWILFFLREKGTQNCVLVKLQFSMWSKGKAKIHMIFVRFNEPGFFLLCWTSMLLVDYTYCARMQFCMCVLHQIIDFFGTLHLAFPSSDFFSMIVVFQYWRWEEVFFPFRRSATKAHETSSHKTAFRLLLHKSFLSDYSLFSSHGSVWWSS